MTRDQARRGSAGFDFGDRLVETERNEPVPPVGV
jgi:hypothetical protein